MNLDGSYSGNRRTDGMSRGDSEEPPCHCGVFLPQTLTCFETGTHQINMDRGHSFSCLGSLQVLLKKHEKDRLCSGLRETHRAKQSSQRPSH